MSLMSDECGVVAGVFVEWLARVTKVQTNVGSIVTQAMDRKPWGYISAAKSGEQPQLSIGGCPGSIGGAVLNHYLKCLFGLLLSNSSTAFCLSGLLLLSK